MRLRSMSETHLRLAKEGYLAGAQRGSATIRMINCAMEFHGCHEEGGAYFGGFLGAQLARESALENGVLRDVASRLECFGPDFIESCFAILACCAHVMARGDEEKALGIQEYLKTQLIRTRNGNVRATLERALGDNVLLDGCGVKEKRALIESFEITAESADPEAVKKPTQRL